MEEYNYGLWSEYIIKEVKSFKARCTSLASFKVVFYEEVTISAFKKSDYISV